MVGGGGGGGGGGGAGGRWQRQFVTCETHSSVGGRIPSPAPLLSPSLSRCLSFTPFLSFMSSRFPSPFLFVFLFRLSCSLCRSIFLPVSLSLSLSLSLSQYIRPSLLLMYKVSIVRQNPGSAPAALVYRMVLTVVRTWNGSLLFTTEEQLESPSSVRG